MRVLVEHYVQSNEYRASVPGIANIIGSGPTEQLAVDRLQAILELRANGQPPYNRSGPIEVWDAEIPSPKRG